MPKANYLYPISIHRHFFFKLWIRRIFTCCEISYDAEIHFSRSPKCAFTPSGQSLRPAWSLVKLASDKRRSFRLERSSTIATSSTIKRDRKWTLSIKFSFLATIPFVHVELSSEVTGPISQSVTTTKTWQEKRAKMRVFCRYRFISAERITKFAGVVRLSFFLERKRKHLIS